MTAQWSYSSKLAACFFAVVIFTAVMLLHSVYFDATPTESPQSLAQHRADKELCETYAHWRAAYWNSFIPTVAQLCHQPYK